MAINDTDLELVNGGDGEENKTNREVPKPPVIPLNNEELLIPPGQDYPKTRLANPTRRRKYW